MSRFFQRFACFQLPFEDGQDVRPTARHRFDQLRIGFVHLVDQSELYRFTMLFEFIGQFRKTFVTQFRFEFIAP